ncbi:MAG: hypothetical protein HY736_00300 [Verrucomicrobia bacterium]|nr:hypothetical protein [Verrucomicrobiota bacterium]
MTEKITGNHIVVLKNQMVLAAHEIEPLPAGALIRFRGTEVQIRIARIRSGMPRHLGRSRLPPTRLNSIRGSFFRVISRVFLTRPSSTKRIRDLLKRCSGPILRSHRSTMSICEQRSLPSIWTWDDPRFPLERLKARWIDGSALDADAVAAVRYNRDHNPDIRIREECRVLLHAAGPKRRAGGAADSLRRRATAARLRKMIVQVPPA